ncbi:MAG: hypothetical protein ABGZ24_05505, partial [Fuerstiella sp.]
TVSRTPGRTGVFKGNEHRHNDNRPMMKVKCGIPTTFSQDTWRERFLISLGTLQPNNIDHR